VGTIRPDVADEEVELIVVHDGSQGADGAATTASRRPQEDPLGLHRRAGGAVVDDPGQRQHRSIVAADLYCDGTLTRGGRHHLGIEPLGDAVREADAVEARAREHERVHLPRVEAAEARVDVAMERLDDEVRPARANETGAPGTVRPHPPAGRHLTEPTARRVRSDHQSIARVRARQVGGDR
jgi:hypothetical protein